MVAELLLGCGSNRLRRVRLPGDPKAFRKGLVTVDQNPSHKPTVEWNLELVPWPFLDESFDVIHAYDVLEHLHYQGDEKAFFGIWNEIYRILRPGGRVYATTPPWDSPWAWADPSHKAIYSPQLLTFLVRPEYARQVGETAMSDYRDIYEGDFDVYLNDTQGDTFVFVLDVHKPRREA